MKGRGRLGRAMDAKTLKWKLLAFKKLGGICQCCEEYRKQFLTIDHIHGGGKEHRNRFTGLTYYRWICKTLGTRKLLQILCMNCNWAKRSGPCPHISEGFRSLQYDKLERKTKREFVEYSKKQAAAVAPAAEGQGYVRHVARLSFKDISGDTSPAQEGFKAIDDRGGTAHQSPSLSSKELN